jgi:uncharacterized protein (TIGR02444 family)
MGGIPSPDHPPSDQETQAELWAFAVSFYDKDGIAAACLALQEEAGVDVVLLIFAMSAAVRLGVVLRAEELAAADHAVHVWRAEIVEPLRRLRRRLKTGPRPAPCSPTDRLRHGLKALELQAERIEFAVLSDWLGGLSRHPGGAAETVQIPELVVRHFARGNAIETKVAEALGVLTNATRQITATGHSPPH